MELQRVVWYWDTMLGRLADSDPQLAASLRRSVRPLEAERDRHGVLTIALGTWWQADLAFLGQEVARDRVSRSLGRMLEDQVRCVIAPWPGGMVAGQPAGEEIPPPDLLAGLPEEAREQAAVCESPLQRYFLAGAYRRGLRPRCQFVLGRYRLDFAFPEERVAAEVVGWAWHRAGRGSGLPSEREEQLGVDSWRVRWFAGSEVATDLKRALDEVERLFGRTSGLPTRQFRATQTPGRDSSPRQWVPYQRRPPRS